MPNASTPASATLIVLLIDSPESDGRPRCCLPPHDRSGTRLWAALFDYPRFAGPFRDQLCDNAEALAANGLTIGVENK